MRVYNVSVYYVDMFNEKYKLEMLNNKKYLSLPDNRFKNFIEIDNIMVIRDAFNTREIITRQPIDLFSSNPYDMAYYNKYGFVLGIRNISLSHKNVIIPKSIERYRDNFLDSDFIKFLRNFENDPIDQDIVNYRINKILKKMKDK